MTSRETCQLGKVIEKFFSAAISLKYMYFRSVKRTLPELAVSMSKLSNRLMSLHRYEKMAIMLLMFPIFYQKLRFVYLININR